MNISWWICIYFIFLSCKAFARRVLQRRRLRRRREAALPIQAAWRRALARAGNIKGKRGAATVIQAWVRRWHTCNGGPADVASRRRKAMLRIQAGRRGDLDRRRVRAMHAAARAIQSQVRVGRFRKAWAPHPEAAVKIQGIWRGALHRMRSAAHLEKWIRVQARMRGYLCRKLHLPRRRRGILVVQRMYRGIVGFEEMVDAIVKMIMVQAWWRSRVKRMRYKRQMWARYTLCGLIYRYRFRQEIWRQAKLNAKMKLIVRRCVPCLRNRRLRVRAEIIQRTFRGAMCRLRLARRREAACLIQACARRGLACAAAERRRASLSKLRAVLSVKPEACRFRAKQSQLVRLQASWTNCYRYYYLRYYC